VHCYVVHFGLFEAGRRRQTQALIAAVRESAPDGEPVIIAGDFNDWRNSLSAELRNALGVREAFDEIGSNSALDELVRTLRRKQGVHPARTFPAALPFSAWTASMCAVFRWRRRKYCMAACGPSCPTMRPSLPI
jgi:endonuclease/exonuclease/phosphatase family metal-dependent hydrolase